MEKIKIFYDGADLNYITSNREKYIDGVTTNPSIMKKAGITNFEKFSKELIQIIPDKPVSLEVFSDDIDEMKKQALKINEWGENIYVKIPITNSEGLSTKLLIHELLKEGVKLNITAVFTLEQVKNIGECFSEHPKNIISIFCGRIADTGTNPQLILKSINEYKDSNNLPIDILWASAREIYNLKQAQESNCQIITLGEDLISKIKNFDKSLEAFSLETVEMFKNDAVEVGYKI